MGGMKTDLASFSSVTAVHKRILKGVSLIISHRLSPSGLYASDRDAADVLDLDECSFEVVHKSQ